MSTAVARTASFHAVGGSQHTPASCGMTGVAARVVRPWGACPCIRSRVAKVNCSASRLSLRPLLVDLPCTITTVVATQTTNRRRGQDVMSKQALMLLSLLAVICAHYRCVTDRGCASSATRAHAINLEHVLHTSRGVSTVPSGRSNWMPLSSSVPRDSEGDTHTRCVTRMVA